MIATIAKKLGWALVTIWAVVSLTFVVYNVLPEDPARVVAGPQARPADVAKIRADLGLDRPLGSRYLVYLGRTLGPPFGDKPESAVDLGPVRLDLGISYLKRRPVVELLGEALGPTLFLGLYALLIQAGVGTLAGVVAAVRKRSAVDWLTVALTLVGISAPTFLTGLLLQYTLARDLRLFPLEGIGDGSFGDLVGHATLPALTLGLYGASYYARLVRDEMIGLLAQDHVRTARAKGLDGTTVVLKHGLRNALLPFVTVIGLNMGTLVGGAIVTEKIFRWPGIGALSVDAIMERDGPVILGVVLLFSTTVVLANLLVDLVYLAVDPRLRHR